MEDKVTLCCHNPIFEASLATSRLAYVFLNKLQPLF